MLTAPATRPSVDRPAGLLRWVTGLSPGQEGSAPRARAALLVDPSLSSTRGQPRGPAGRSGRAGSRSRGVSEATPSRRSARTARTSSSYFVDLGEGLDLLVRADRDPNGRLAARQEGQRDSIRPRWPTISSDRLSAASKLQATLGQDAVRVGEHGRGVGVDADAAAVERPAAHLARLAEQRQRPR